jgi:hypothetical protein
MCTIRSDKTFGQRSSALAVRFLLFGIFLFGTELFPTANVGEATFSQSQSGAMMDTIRSDTATVVESGQSATSWAAIIAGGVAAAALTLVLLAFGSGMGFSAVSPWSNAGVSASTFKLATGVYLIIVSMLSSTIGGYIAGRLRTKWVGLHSEEVLFRDTAHGFLAWAFAAILGAAALGAAATYVVGGTAQGVGQPAAQSAGSPTSYFVDMLFRPIPGGQSSTAGQPAKDPAAARREIITIFTRAALREGDDLSAADSTYVAQMVSAQTGMSQVDADKRVAEVTKQAKEAADQARKAAAKLSMWLTASLLIGAFAASLAAIEGGQLRDGTWRGVIGGKKYRTAQTS